MATELVNTKSLDRAAWLEWRQKGIGGSDASAVAGINRYRSRMEVYLDKIGELPPIEPNEAMYWGNRLEDIVAEEFTARTGIKTWRYNAILQHPQHEWMLANIDRRLVGTDKPGLLECKTASAYKADEWDGDEVPDEYMLQLQHYLAVTGWDLAYIAVLIGGQQLVVHKVERDEELINYLIRIEGDFWNLVQERTPPAIDGSKASSDLLDRMYPEGRNDEITLSKEAAQILANYDRAKEQMEVREREVNHCKNQLKQMMEEYEIAKCGDRRITWKTIERKNGTSYRRFLIQ